MASITTNKRGVPKPETEPQVIATSALTASTCPHGHWLQQQLIFTGYIWPALSPCLRFLHLGLPSFLPLVFAV